MKFENHMPIYIQIVDQLKTQLIMKEKSPGEQLPSVREYALQLKVNPNTVQKAYQEMERQGLIYFQRGIGTFIVEDQGLISRLKAEISTEIIEKFIDHMKAIGYDNQAIMLKINQILNGGC